jgi:hypothetical protein
MPAACPTCGADNRAGAMFCRGCLAKLPAFAPTAPSMLESMRAAPADGPRARPLGGGPASARIVASWMVLLGVALLVGVSALVVWAATSARVPHMRSPPVLPQVQAAVAPPRMRTEEEREVLTAAHVQVTRPETTSEDREAATQPIPLQALTPDQGVKQRPARVATAGGAKPRKENRRSRHVRRPRGMRPLQPLWRGALHAGWLPVQDLVGALRSAMTVWQRAERRRRLRANALKVAEPRA